MCVRVCVCLCVPLLHFILQSGAWLLGNISAVGRQWRENSNNWITLFFTWFPHLNDHFFQSCIFCSQTFTMTATAQREDHNNLVRPGFSPSISFLFLTAVFLQVSGADVLKMFREVNTEWIQSNIPRVVWLSTWFQVFYWHVLCICYNQGVKSPALRPLCDDYKFVCRLWPLLAKWAAMIKPHNNAWLTCWLNCTVGNVYIILFIPIWDDCKIHLMSSTGLSKKMFKHWSANRWKDRVNDSL